MCIPHVPYSSSAGLTDDTQSKSADTQKRGKRREADLVDLYMSNAGLKVTTEDRGLLFFGTLLRPY